MNTINKLNLKPTINKYDFFKKLHIKENTETFKSSDVIFDELVEILSSKMHLDASYVVINPFEVTTIIKYSKYIVCFVSSEDNINDVVNETMSRGEYFKGYLLNEMSTHVLFNASNEMNNMIKREALNEGLFLSKRYAAGDGEIELQNQNKILEELKKHISTNAFVNEDNVIVPQKSLLYFYGLKDGKSSENDCDTCNECNNCTKINCEYKEIE